jgi:hypothetical protein
MMRAAAPSALSRPVFRSTEGKKGAQMIDGIIFVIMGVWILLIGLGKARVSKNPEATAPWLKKWGVVLRICGPIMALAGIVGIVADLARR